MNCQMELKNFAGLMVRVGNLTHRIRHELILWSSLTSEAKELLVIVEEFKLKDSVPNSVKQKIANFLSNSPFFVKITNRGAHF